MSSRLIVISIRHTGASADAITLDNSGNATFPANVTCSGTATGFGGGKVVDQKFASVTTNEQNPSGDQTWTLVGPQITHTAASTSNKLVFLHSHHLMVEGALTWRMALWRDGTSGTNLYEMRTYLQLSSNWVPVVGITNVTATPPDTSSHTYQFAIYREGGSDGLVRYSPNSASSGSQIMMLEVEP